MLVGEVGGWGYNRLPCKAGLPSRVATPTHTATTHSTQHPWQAGNQLPLALRGKPPTLTAKPIHAPCSHQTPKPGTSGLPLTHPTHLAGEASHHDGKVHTLACLLNIGGGNHACSRGRGAGMTQGKGRYGSGQG